MADSPPVEPDPQDAQPTGPKRVMGGRPTLPRVVGRPAPPVIDDSEWEAVPETQFVHGISVDPSKVPSGIQFHHDCCEAVRPNPEDPDAGGAVQEMRQEPYVTWQGPLKPTATFGAWAAGLGLAFLATFFLGIGHIFVGMWIGLGVSAAGFVYVVVSVIVTSSSMKGIRLMAARHITEPKLERGKVFHATLETNGTVVPGWLRIRITDQQAPGLRPVQQPLLEGPGQVTYKVRPQGRGLLTFSGLDVVARSFDGMWIAEQEWRLRTTVEVGPSLSAITWKALVTGYAPFDQSTPSSIVKLFRDIETEVIRDMAAGDKMRDVNWKYFARMGKMIVRQRTSEGETTILLVFDCTPTMLMDQAGYRNLDLAVEIAQEFAEAGLKRNHEAGMIAFNENRVLDHVRPTRAKIQFKKLIKHFENLANHHLADEGEDPVEILITGDPENLRLAFGQGLKQRNTAGLTIIFFSDLQGTPDEIIQVISKAAGSGQKVAVMLMPEPKLKPIIPGQPQELTMRGIAHTNKMRELLIANGCEFVEVNPHAEDFSLRTDDEGSANGDAPAKPESSKGPYWANQR
ncbi:MAG: DUF58 domain-containing protein [bacterium]